MKVPRASSDSDSLPDVSSDSLSDDSDLENDRDQPKVRFNILIRIIWLSIGSSRDGNLHTKIINMQNVSRKQNSRI